ncbi:flagellar basal body-associated protein FliL [Aquamicrobium lusatiense]|jgi:flagellar basal body-associated protein FliL|uniref:Flagellar basal body-associated protein FliL n=1 Tax=Aquamicrobium lusatiense TaxID=89772 RepID=A0A7W9RY99_9HYPH|nr:hypothetical protein [Aquamicrobium lusatiense]MBB6010716.1 flagellar basal body-associated protein FliL [Aquamicrobium lusatiense]
MARIFREQAVRQGRKGSRVLVILICAIVLALAAWAATALLVPKPDAPAGQTSATETVPAQQ